MFMAMTMMVYKSKGISGVVKSLFKFTTGIVAIGAIIWGLMQTKKSSAVAFNALLVVLLLVITGYIILKAKRSPQRVKQAFKVMFDAIPSLLLLVIVIGGIVAGFFTATEASAIAVLYAFVLALIYKEMTIKICLR